MRRLLLPLRLLVDSVRRRGVRGTLRRFLRMLMWAAAERRRARVDRAFDESLGIETATWVRVPDLETTSANRRHAVRYQPSSIEEFELLMSKLEIDHSDFVFVDYGSGKGRVLLLAARYPFRRIIGVEFSESLVRIARQNVATLGPDARRVESVVTDAVEFELPDEPLMLYFFNPFAEPVLEAVLERVNVSLDRRPRTAYVVATAPSAFAETIEGAGFDPVDVDRLGWMTRGVFLARPRGSSRGEGPPQGA